MSAVRQPGQPRCAGLHAHERSARTASATAMPVAQVGTIPLSSSAAALHAQNVQSSIMASVGQEQAAAIPDVGDFSSFSS